MFQRIAIVNRGEAAMRLIRAVRDINACEDEGSIRAIALYTEDERGALFVRAADESYSLGDAATRPYLDHAKLEQALRAVDADAVWVGWGFVAEDPSFAELCARLGVTFIGPSPEAMHQLGDKIGAKLAAEAAEVSIAPWSGGPVETLEDARAAASRVGYPLMLKASGGGGGRGIRVIASEAELEAVYQRTRDEAARAFGNDTVFLEQLVAGGRHVEVQVIADQYGTAWALGVRDCSVQRRHQKVIEESSSPLLSPAQAENLKASAERLIQAVGYCGAATVEFLYRPETESFAFLEVNTRLQVEHPVTEITTGVDLVRLQIQVAAGGRLSGPRPVEFGHAVEARLNAEDADNEFAPAPGRIQLLNLPCGPGVRVDTGFAVEDTIPPSFDSMIAKIVAYGPTRPAALNRLRRALQETEVVIHGGVSNKSFLLELLRQPELVNGRADTQWIDREHGRGRLLPRRNADIAVMVAGIHSYQQTARRALREFLESARGGRPAVQHHPGAPIEVRLRGLQYRVTVRKSRARRFQVTVECSDQSRTVEAEVRELRPHHLNVTVRGRTFNVLSDTYDGGCFVEVDGVGHRITIDDGGVLRAPSPALVVGTAVGLGEEVAAGQPVLLLEAMKMETRIEAPFAGFVQELYVAPGSQVEAGAPLLRLQRGTDDGSASAPGQRSPATAEIFGQELASERSETIEDHYREAFEDARAQLLGFDPTEHDGVADRYIAARRGAVAAGMNVLAPEIELARIFVDVTSLQLDRWPVAQPSTQLRPHSPRECFHRFLQTLDVEQSDLPGEFRQVLTRVLGHYGIVALESTTELKEALLRLHLGKRRTEIDRQLLLALLRCWELDPAPSPELRSAASAVLDLLGPVARTSVPALVEVVRSVRFRWFEQPTMDARHQSAAAHVRAHLEACADHTSYPMDHLDALVSASDTILADLFSTHVDTKFAGVLLEAMARKHYPSISLGNVRPIRLGERPVLWFEHQQDGTNTQLVTAVVEFHDLLAEGQLLRLLTATGGPSPHLICGDLYLRWPQAPTDPQLCAARLTTILRSSLDNVTVRRLTVGVLAGSNRPIQYITVEARDGEMLPTPQCWGAHPADASRLGLSRWGQFQVARVDTLGDVVLYDCVATTDKTDHRLLALLDVAPSSAEDGTTQTDPWDALRQLLPACAEGIQRARRAGRADDKPVNLIHLWIHLRSDTDLNVAGAGHALADFDQLITAAGIQEVLIYDRTLGAEVRTVFRISSHPQSGVTVAAEEPLNEAVKPLDAYDKKLLRCRERGAIDPYQLHALAAGDTGRVTEYDLDETGQLGRVDRAPGQNEAGIVVGVVTTPTQLYPEGITRVVVCGDSMKALGAVAEPECRRIIAAIDLAEEIGAPVEWYALSAGALISMSSGTENMDWVARALKRIIEFTQAGGEINIVVTGINVGAQPYWNAEATMLMHTKGILVMTPVSSMVLTGKKSLDFSGGVSAEDNLGIGGYDRVMGPNGQAQYWAPDLRAAREIVLAHYEYTYVAAGERRPRRSSTVDPHDRDISAVPHCLPGSDLRAVGDIFSVTSNPDRKKPFDIRVLMRAVCDQDHLPLERWAEMAAAETAVVFDARIGGWSVCLIGVESRGVRRIGLTPADGPDVFTAGTLFPLSSKKVARAINAASGNRPLVVLANLSGFDGSPDSMRHLQLEYGAEIGRAVVNFQGPIVFCVVSRYHGGAFVVFSKALNPRMTVLALEGSFASVIGGAPAASAVFSREVDRRTATDDRVSKLEHALTGVEEPERSRLSAELAEARAAVRAEKLADVAEEFDALHSIERAMAVGSVDNIITARELRAQIIGALEPRGSSFESPSPQMGIEEEPAQAIVDALKAWTFTPRD
jgi:acetyl/propionyl-CoA carboxylase alpha subunit/acetyl-CoA carboxylase carboxyltransferase component